MPFAPSTRRAQHEEREVGLTPPGAFVLDLTGQHLPAPLNLVGLGRAIAGADVWEGAHEPVVVIRTEPRPALGVFARWEPPAAARIDSFLRQVPAALAVLRYVDWSGAEQTAAALARAVHDQLGDGVSEASFRAVPRGGHFVLGMLAYLLSLDHHQLHGDIDPTGPLVLVDDVALSGAGLRRYLRQVEHPAIVIGHLYSHPGLRRAILAAEPHVTAVVAGSDLADHTVAFFGEDAGDWRRRWIERTDGDAYWMGYLDHITLPWTEPEWAFAEPGGGIETGWRLLPPELVLKHRSPADHRQAELQVVATAAGPIRPAELVLWARRGEDRTLVSNGDTVLALDGPAHDMWWALLHLGTIAKAAAHLAHVYDAPAGELAAGLAELVDELSRRGILAGASAA